FENTSRPLPMGMIRNTGTSQYFFLASTKRTNCLMKDTARLRVDQALGNLESGAAGSMQSETTLRSRITARCACRPLPNANGQGALERPFPGARDLLSSLFMREAPSVP